MAKAQTVTQGHIDALNTALFGENPPSEFLLKQWERDARALIRKGGNEAADGYQLLGVLAVFNNDVEQIDANFQKAMRLDPGTALIAENYATALLATLHSRRACQRVLDFGLDRLLRQGGDASKALAVLLSVCGHVGKALELIGDTGEPMETSQTTTAEISIQWIACAHAELQEVGLNDDALACWIDCAETVLREKLPETGCKPWQLRAEYLYMEEFGCAIDYHAPVTAGQALELNLAIFAAQARLDYPTVLSFPTISVVPHRAG
ncbi:hypothetical protein [Aquitalea pelogenes]|uniref:hypothetical protein n=1 Tax=Aquitalea pelogenes TaxID=1293573 RepID=UPI0035B4A3E6